MGQQVKGYFGFVAQKQQNPPLIIAENLVYHKYVDTLEGGCRGNKKSYSKASNKKSNTC